MGECSIGIGQLPVIKFNQPSWRRYEQDIAQLLEEFADVTTVEHDATRQGAISGQDRQVDVWVEGTVAGLDVTVAVECKLLAEPVGIGVVDEFHGKLADLGADKGVMYSDSGYTKPALARADKQRQPSIALVERSADFNYAEFLGLDCPNENCYTGSIGWERPNIARIPDDSSMFRAGSCDSCGVWAVDCGTCSSVNAFFWDEVECEGCGSTWQLEYDRDRIEEAIRQLTDAEGTPLVSDG